MTSIAKFHPVKDATFSHYGFIGDELHVIFTTIPKNAKSGTLDIRKVEDVERKTIEGIIKRGQ
jgi:hypothetical protein